VALEECRWGTKSGRPARNIEPDQLPVAVPFDWSCLVESRDVAGVDDASLHRNDRESRKVNVGAIAAVSDRASEFPDVSSRCRHGRCQYKTFGRSEVGVLPGFRTAGMPCWPMVIANDGLAVVTPIGRPMGAT
jgi:predicted DNA binding protein